jgi:hypothetical protein
MPTFQKMPVLGRTELTIRAVKIDHLTIGERQFNNGWLPTTTRYMLVNRPITIVMPDIDKLIRYLPRPQALSLQCESLVENLTNRFHIAYPPQFSFSAFHATNCFSISSIWGLSSNGTGLLAKDTYASSARPGGRVPVTFSRNTVPTSARSQSPICQLAMTLPSEAHPVFSCEGRPSANAVSSDKVRRFVVFRGVTAREWFGSEFGPDRFQGHDASRHSGTGVLQGGCRKFCSS